MKKINISILILLLFLSSCGQELSSLSSSLSSFISSISSFSSSITSSSSESSSALQNTDLSVTLNSNLLSWELLRENQFDKFEIRTEVANQTGFRVLKTVQSNERSLNLAEILLHEKDNTPFKGVYKIYVSMIDRNNRLVGTPSSKIDIVKAENIDIKFYPDKIEPRFYWANLNVYYSGYEVKMNQEIVPLTDLSLNSNGEVELNASRFSGPQTITVKPIKKTISNLNFIDANVNQNEKKASAYLGLNLEFNSFNNSFLSNINADDLINFDFSLIYEANGIEYVEKMNKSTLKFDSTESSEYSKIKLNDSITVFLEANPLANAISQFPNLIYNKSFNLTLFQFKEITPTSNFVSIKTFIDQGNTGISWSFNQDSSLPSAKYHLQSFKSDGTSINLNGSELIDKNVNLDYSYVFKENKPILYRLRILPILGSSSNWHFFDQSKEQPIFSIITNWKLSYDESQKLVTWPEIEFHDDSFSQTQKINPNQLNYFVKSNLISSSNRINVGSSTSFSPKNTSFIVGNHTNTKISVEVSDTESSIPTLIASETNNAINLTKVEDINNFRYDPVNKKLLWNRVANATEYKIDIVNKLTNQSISVPSIPQNISNLETVFDQPAGVYEVKLSTRTFLETNSSSNSNPSYVIDGESNSILFAHQLQIEYDSENFSLIKKWLFDGDFIYTLKYGNNLDKEFVWPSNPNLRSLDIRTLPFYSTLEEGKIRFQVHINNPQTSSLSFQLNADITNEAEISLINKVVLYKDLSRIYWPKIAGAKEYRWKITKGKNQQGIITQPTTGSSNFNAQENNIQISLGIDGLNLTDNYYEFEVETIMNNGIIKQSVSNISFIQGLYIKLSTLHRNHIEFLSISNNFNLRFDISLENKILATHVQTENEFIINLAEIDISPGEYRLNIKAYQVDSDSSLESNVINSAFSNPIFKLAPINNVQYNELDQKLSWSLPVRAHEAQITYINWLTGDENTSVNNNELNPSQKGYYEVSIVALGDLENTISSDPLEGRFAHRLELYYDDSFSFDSPMYGELSWDDVSQNLSSLSYSIEASQGGNQNQVVNSDLHEPSFLLDSSFWQEGLVQISVHINDSYTSGFLFNGQYDPLTLYKLSSTIPTYQNKTIDWTDPNLAQEYALAVIEHPDGIENLFIDSPSKILVSTEGFYEYHIYTLGNPSNTIKSNFSILRIAEINEFFYDDNNQQSFYWSSDFNLPEGYEFELINIDNQTIIYQGEARSSQLSDSLNLIQGNHRFQLSIASIVDGNNFTSSANGAINILVNKLSPITAPNFAQSILSWTGQGSRYSIEFNQSPQSYSTIDNLLTSSFNFKTSTGFDPGFYEVTIFTSIAEGAKNTLRGDPVTVRFLDRIELMFDDENSLITWDEALLNQSNDIKIDLYNQGVKFASDLRNFYDTLAYSNQFKLGNNEITGKVTYKNLPFLDESNWFSNEVSFIKHAPMTELEYNPISKKVSWAPVETADYYEVYVKGNFSSIVRNDQLLEFSLSDLNLHQWIEIRPMSDANHQILVISSRIDVVIDWTFKFNKANANLDFVPVPNMAYQVYLNDSPIPLNLNPIQTTTFDLSLASISVGNNQKLTAKVVDPNQVILFKFSDSVNSPVFFNKLPTPGIPSDSNGMFDGLQFKWTYGTLPVDFQGFVNNKTFIKSYDAVKSYNFYSPNYDTEFQNGNNTFAVRAVLFNHSTVNYVPSNYLTAERQLTKIPRVFAELGLLANANKQEFRLVSGSLDLNATHYDIKLEYDYDGSGTDNTETFTWLRNSVLKKEITVSGSTFRLVGLKYTITAYSSPYNGNLIFSINEGILNPL